MNNQSIAGYDKIPSKKTGIYAMTVSEVIAYKQKLIDDCLELEGKLKGIPDSKEKTQIIETIRRLKI